MHPQYFFNNRRKGAGWDYCLIRLSKELQFDYKVKSIYLSKVFKFDFELYLINYWDCSILWTLVKIWRLQTMIVSTVKSVWQPAGELRPIGVRRSGGPRSAVLLKAITMNGSKSYFSIIPKWRQTELIWAWKSPEHPNSPSTACMDLGFRGYKRESNFCSKGQNSRICIGDSGGPLFCTNKNKELVLLV